jgi:hypothetical protein
MYKEGVDTKNNPTTPQEVLKYPDIPEIPQNLQPFLFEEFDSTRGEKPIKDDESGDTWILEHFENKDVKIINLFNSLTYETYQARIIDDNNRIIRKLERTEHENKIKQLSFVTRNDHGEWIKVPSDQNPNDQQL